MLAFMPFSCLHDKPHDHDRFWFGEVCGGVRGLYFGLTQLIEHPAGHPGSAKNAPYLYEFRSLTLNVPEYLNWLVRRLTEKNDLEGPPVKLVRITKLASLHTAAYLVPDANLIINATGLGSQDLLETQDKGVYPIRGQTVVVSAPRFRNVETARCWTKIVNGESTYIIPRARTGHVILGGTFDVRQSDCMIPDAKVTERIIRDSVELAPELLPEGVDAMAPDAWKHAKVLRVNTGLRPAREGGARVELDSTPIRGPRHQVGVIHAYGIGPAGYQASYGIAQEVVQFAEEWERNQQQLSARL